jgi:hypothetical protein
MVKTRINLEPLLPYAECEMLANTASARFSIVTGVRRHQQPFPGDQDVVCQCFLDWHGVQLMGSARCAAYLAFSEHWESEKDLLLRQCKRSILNQLITMVAPKINIII